MLVGVTLDAWLAVAHHAGAFGVLAVLVAEWVLVRPGLTRVDALRVQRIDAFYGLAAATVVIAGIARVTAGAKASEVYTENPVYWLKMATFVAVGLLSIRPTLAYLRWRRADADPPAAEVSSARRAVGAQLLAFPLIPFAAALMARGIGL